MRCRAAVLTAPHQDMTIEEIEIGDLDPGEVLVRIGAAGLCHTDLEVIEGQLAYPMPIVLGHEAAGTIERVGAGVDPQRVGDQVVLSWNPHCGQCFHCVRGNTILCEPYVALGPKAVPFSGKAKLHLDGRDLHTMFYMSAFAEYAVVTEACAVSVPPEIPFDRACLLGCGVLTGVGAVTRIAELRADETAMVIGCGAVGLSAVQGARLAGARQIVAVDLADDKLATARLLGATHVVNAHHQDPVVAVREITEGRGADCVVESAGNNDAFRASVEACRAGGAVVWLGKVGINDEVAFRWGSLMGEKRITRCSYGGAQTASDFPWLARSYLEGDLKLDEMISQHLRLEDINSGFDDLHNGRTIRSIVQFEH
ncbi:MAG: alcohol dehydrogenase catalytic domain-containing protein [Pseudonocardiaceae bacterium]|nr:alcohol dehydrogenase catalytic domain-containing protein [Pseudonocardiaceae bacterium]